MQPDYAVAAMNGAFNGQILVDKLTKLNCTQQSIETLSHWCIFHRKHAKLVVETWEQQFHCSPTEQRVAFLYLANDILQNSRRKGSEFINEFFRVLPGALSDVHNNGGDYGRSTVSRLMGIWEERKVFGSHVQVLKDVMLGRKLDNRRNGKAISCNKQPGGELMEKVIASYQDICNLNMDEDALLGKCQAAISYVQEAERELSHDDKSGGTNGPQVRPEFQMQHGILRQCIETLKVAESSRGSLASVLRKALNEQEIKLEEIKQKIQVAQSLYQQTRTIISQLKTGEIPSEQGLKESSISLFTASSPPGFSSEPTSNAADRAGLSPVRYSQDETFINHNIPHSAHDHNKQAAAAMAAKLTASSGSAQVLSYVLSSLASDGVIGNNVNEEYLPDNKRAKVDNNSTSLSSPQLQPPLPPFPHPDFLQQPPPPPPTGPPSPPTEPPPLPPPPPAMPPTPLPPPLTTAQYVPTAPGHMLGMPYNYSVPIPLPNYSMAGMPPMYPGPLNPYNNFQRPDVNNNHHFGQPQLQPPSAQPPLTRQ